MNIDRVLVEHHGEQRNIRLSRDMGGFGAEEELREHLHGMAAVIRKGIKLNDCALVVTIRYSSGSGKLVVQVQRD